MPKQWRKVGMSENLDTRRNGIGTETVGTFLGTEENVGPNKSKVHNLKLEDGKYVQIWGSTVLDSRLSQVPEGTDVKIVYLGQEKSPTAGRSAFHNYDVFVDDGGDDDSEESPKSSEESSAEGTDDLPF